MGNIKHTSTQELAKKLYQKTDLTKNQIREDVEETRKQYKGLITSKKNALILYAREEKGVQLLDKKPPELQIENIVPDMRQVNLQAKIHSVDRFQYQKDGETRRGCSVKLFDDSGSIEMMLWGDDVDQVSKTLEGSVVEIRNGYTSMYEGDVQINFKDGTTVEKVE